MPRGVYRRGEAAQAATQVQEPEAATQAVSPRAAEMRRERRRRNDGDLDRMAALKLAIPQEVRDQGRREDKVFRWVLDSRVPEMFQNDWDAVEGVTPVQANPMSGTEEKLVLCSKYRDWHEEDQRRDESIIDEREQELLKGRGHGASEDGRSSSGLRVPDRQANRISRERGL